MWTSLSRYTDNNIKKSLVLGEGPIDRKDSTKIMVEAKYSVNITKSRKGICLNLHYNVANSFLYANNMKTYQFKVKNSEIKPYTLGLGNISKNFKDDNMKKTELQGYEYNFFVDYNTINTSYIVDIHKYLMKKYNIV